MMAVLSIDPIGFPVSSPLPPRFSIHILIPPISLPPPISLQVRSFFALCWRQSPVLYDELGLLRDVHGPLRAKVLQHVGAQIRPQIPILQARVPCKKSSR